MLNAMPASYFSRLKNRVCKMALRACIDLIILNEGRPDLRRSFIGYALVLSDKTTISLKGLSPVLYPVYSALLNVGIDCIAWQIPNEFELAM